MKKLLIIIPVYNEEKILRDSVISIKTFFDNRFPPNGDISYDIAIAGRSNTDRTNEIATELEKEYDNVFYSEIDHPEKGARIRRVCVNIDYDFYSFIDCDLPIRMDDFYNILSEIIFNEADMAIASKYAPGAKQNRAFIRILMSRCYNLLVQLLFPQIKVRDQFCGIKAWNRRVTLDILPLVANTHYFFDSEIIYYCFEKGYKVKEVPVFYNDPRPGASKVNIFSDSLTVVMDLIKFFIQKQILKKQ